LKDNVFDEGLLDHEQQEMSFKLTE